MTWGKYTPRPNSLLRLDPQTSGATESVKRPVTDVDIVKRNERMAALRNEPLLGLLLEYLDMHGADGFSRYGIANVLVDSFSPLYARANEGRLDHGGGVLGTTRLIYEMRDGCGEPWCLTFWGLDPDIDDEIEQFAVRSFGSDGSYSNWKRLPDSRKQMMFDDIADYAAKDLMQHLVETGGYQWSYNHEFVGDDGDSFIVDMAIIRSAAGGE